MRTGPAGRGPAQALDRDRRVRIPVGLLIGEEKVLLADQEDVVSASSQRRDHFDAMTPAAPASIPRRGGCGSPAVPAQAGASSERR
jgi:hypothetical protein